MLVLSRRVMESIEIGDDIEISVIEIKGNRVKLAISAPREVGIRRSELPPLPVSMGSGEVSVPFTNRETSLSVFVASP